MKQLVVYLLFCIFYISLNANPISLPTAHLSEFYFDDNGDWTIELIYDFYDNESYPIQNVLISSLTDTAQVSIKGYNYEGAIIVLTKDSLTVPFNINPLGDVLSLHTLVMDEYIEYPFIFGNIEHAVISAPRKGQSICSYMGVYVKDKSPSIGKSSDTIGIFGTLKGVVYDIDLKPVSNRGFSLWYDSKLNTDDNGNYLSRVLSRPSSYNVMVHFMDDDHYDYLRFNTIAFTMEPDSVVENDIYLTDTLKTVSSIWNNDMSPVRIFPNPIMSNSALTIELDLPVNSSNIKLELFTLDGKLIFTKEIREKISHIPVGLNDGYYVLNLSMDGHVFANQKLCVVND